MFYLSGVSEPKVAMVTKIKAQEHAPLRTMSALYTSPETWT